MKMQRGSAWRTGLIAFSAALLTIFVSLNAVSVQEPSQRAPRVRGNCQTCHKVEALEWMQAGHARAWTNEAFVQATNNRTKQECLPCHAPDKILVTGFGKEPKLRSEKPEHGVDCVACHQDAAGASHGTIGLNPDEHKVVKDPKFGTVEMCAACHAKLGTVEEYKQSKWSNDPRACVTCHMPEVKRAIAMDKPARTGHVHSIRGATPEEFKKGIQVTANASGDNLVIKLSSIEVGHNFPTGTDLVVGIVDVRVMSSGQEVLKHQTLLANDSASGGTDTRLKPGETREITVPLQGAKGEAVVRILHKGFREMPDEKAVVLFETKVSAGS